MEVQVSGAFVPVSPTRGHSGHLQQMLGRAWLSHALGPGVCVDTPTVSISPGGTSSRGLCRGHRGSPLASLPPTPTTWLPSLAPWRPPMGLPPSTLPHFSPTPICSSRDQPMVHQHVSDCVVPTAVCRTKTPNPQHGSQRPHSDLQRLMGPSARCAPRFLGLALWEELHVPLPWPL